MNALEYKEKRVREIGGSMTPAGRRKRHRRLERARWARVVMLAIRDARPYNRAARRRDEKARRG